MCAYHCVYKHMCVPVCVCIACTSSRPELSSINVAVLVQAVGYFRHANHFTYCMETYLKLENVQALMAVRNFNFGHAFIIILMLYGAYSY
mgnify:CR=1 FL=1